MSGEKGGGDEASIAIILFGGLAITLLVTIWWLFHPQISQGIIWLRQGQMAVADTWVPEDNMLDEPITRQRALELAPFRQRHRGLENPIGFEAWQDYLPRSNPAAYNFGDFKFVSELALKPYLPIISLILMLFAVHSYYRGPTSWFKRKFDLEGLIKEQSNTFPFIKPFIDFDPSKANHRAPGDPVPVDLPMFSEALGPEEWVALNRIPMPDKKLDQRIAEKAFTKQLGRRWRGPKSLQPYEQILLAAFCLKTSRKRTESDDLLGRLSLCWSHNKGLALSKDKNLLKDAIKILKDKNLAASTINIMKQHAFVVPAMVRALHHARSEGGVLAPATFLWLRGHDRNLYYALNNLGKQAYHTEALGAMAHYIAEKRSRRPIPVPKVQEAVKSVASWVEGPDARPIPELDYGKAGKPTEDGKPPIGKSKGIMKPAGSK